MRRTTTWAILGVAVLGLSACLDNDLECGLAGAATGAVIANSTGGNVTTGALIGGTAGVLANDVNPNLCN
jgi:hypothetical protein